MSVLRGTHDTSAALVSWVPRSLLDSSPSSCLLSCHIHPYVHVVLGNEPTQGHVYTRLVLYH